MAEPHGGKIEVLASELEKPLLDTRTYRIIRLPNKLEALLIHDADTDKAAAGMNVNAGSFSDAEDMPGMAHAVEHLLFMGTEKVEMSTSSGENSNRLTCSYLVSWRERLQLISKQIWRLFERLHREDVHQLLL
jgi:predicted Zn-dependent peptidase